MARVRNGSSCHTIFGSAPSRIEVEVAATELCSFAGGIIGYGTGLCTLLQVPVIEVRALLAEGYAMVNDAFQLLLTDSSIKKLVVSLASDQAIWDAIMNNEMVKKLKHSMVPGFDFQARQQYFAGSLSEGDKESDVDVKTRFWRWVEMMVRTMAGEVIKKFQELLEDVLQTVTRSRGNGRRERIETPAADCKVKSSFVLSILVVVIVVLTRAELL